MMTGGVGGGEGVQETVVADLIDREGGSMMKYSCCLSVSSEGMRRSVARPGQLFSRYCWSISSPHHTVR